MVFNKLFIASDHAGVSLKEALLYFCRSYQISYEDLGTPENIAVDYPDYAYQVVQKILKAPDSGGILICGTGIGMSIAANRFPGIRAALCYNKAITDLARRHNNANILCLGARLMEDHQATECLQLFLQTPFEKGRHQTRLEKIDAEKSNS